MFKQASNAAAGAVALAKTEIEFCEAKTAELRAVFEQHSRNQALAGPAARAWSAANEALDAARGRLKGLEAAAAAAKTASVAAAAKAVAKTPEAMIEVTKPFKPVLRVVCI